MSTFAKRIKELRKEKGLTQDALAKIFFLNKSSISKYENGNHIPENDLLRKIANYFGVTIDYLLGITDIRNPLAFTSFKGPGGLPLNDFTNENTSVLTKKDEKEIEKRVEELKKGLLESQDGLMLSGNPVSPEAIQSIVDALEFGMRQAKLINKKYTPKKYRKNDD